MEFVLGALAFGLFLIYAIMSIVWVWELLKSIYYGIRGIDYKMRKVEDVAEEWLRKSNINYPDDLFKK
jgi:hypothetical protein